MKREKLWPPYLFRWLAQQDFQRRHPDAPVMVANAVLILDSWLHDSDCGLEWGSGRSTPWLAQRVRHLVSVEHDPAWYRQTRSLLQARNLVDKVDYRLVDAPHRQLDEPLDHPYAKVADEFEDESLDFVIVDGQMRLRCVQHAISKVRTGGLLVLDGANRYLPNLFGTSHSTIQEKRSDPLDAEWRAVSDALASWRALHTSDGLWVTRFWIKTAVGG